jgi:hypothetical protein
LFCNDKKKFMFDISPIFISISFWFIGHDAVLHIPTKFPRIQGHSLFHQNNSCPKETFIYEPKCNYNSTSHLKLKNVTEVDGNEQFIFNLQNIIFEIHLLFYI